MIFGVASNLGLRSWLQRIAVVPVVCPIIAQNNYVDCLIAVATAAGYSALDLAVV